MVPFYDLEREKTGLREYESLRCESFRQLETLAIRERRERLAALWYILASCKRVSRKRTRLCSG